MTASFGRQLPHIVSGPPGPASRALAQRLRRVESRNITHVAGDWPVFWEEAAGANVRDADGNVYVDLTGGFGVANAGHAAHGVSSAIARQAARLPHALGDVHPSAVKVELLERLAALAPAPLGVSVLGLSGADAVEAALKTAMLATGRGGFVAFHGGYHGLSIGSTTIAAASPSRTAARTSASASSVVTPASGSAKRASRARAPSRARNGSLETARSVIASAPIDRPW